MGTIVLPANANLMELIPHEVTHAVMAHLVGVHSGDDESLATSVGKLTTSHRQRAASARLGGVMTSKWSLDDDKALLLHACRQVARGHLRGA